MNLIRFNQETGFPSLFSNIEKTMEQIAESSKENNPMVNIKNEEKNFVIELAAPGMEKKDFSIKLENNRLTISSNKEEEKEETKEKFTLKEYSISSFSRSFTLSKNIEVEQINAEYKNGILNVILPKKEAEEKVDREIEIS